MIFGTMVIYKTDRQDSKDFKIMKLSDFKENHLVIGISSVCLLSSLGKNRYFDRDIVKMTSFSKI